ncbi:hypothetical protein [Microbacterium phyllosphaerae]|uniref:hypothetical protein n=1 Tax=Microbacterium phyllosphaerae TaxID=124798 RepID=UPI0021687915|nr:hypothetical protein [Microbacterium phyllosphaerae]MCS3442935.1 hypothetical protein [Microbacterium phyllosphaerae]
MKQPRTMPRSALEYAIGRPLSVAVVVLNVILAAVATVLCVGMYLHDTASMRPILGVLVAVPALWWVIAVTLWLTTLSRRRVSAEDISRANASVPGGILLPGSKLVPAMTLVAALAAAVTFAVAAVTVRGAGSVVWAVFAVLLLGPIVSHLISLRQPRRLLLHPRGLGSATFHLDAEVHWDDIQSIDLGVGMNNSMVLKVAVRPGAVSCRERWRHPFSRRRGVIDVDPSALGVDGTLLWLALRLYRLEPSTREELRGDRVPGRLLDPTEAVATTPQHVSGPVLMRFTPRA